MSSIYDKSSLVLIPSGTKTSKVYSQKPTNGDGDFDFTRSTAATRVNADGNIEKETSNLLLQSNSFDTGWINSNSTETGGQSGYDGTSDAWQLTASSAGLAYLQQSNTKSGVQTFSVYAKAGTADHLQVYITGTDSSHYFDLTNGTASSPTGAGAIDSSIEDIGGSWYRCSCVCNGTNATLRLYIRQGINVNPSSGEYIYIQDAQLEQGLVARDYIETTTTALYGGITDNVPRLDYTDSSCPALLLEPQRTNICPNSEDVSNWYLTFATATANDTISPEGVQNAAKIVTSSTGCDVKLTNIPVSASTTYTATFYCKLTSGSGLQTRFYDNTNGANIEYYDYSSQLVVGEWKRVTRTFTTPAGCNNIQIWFLAASSSASVTAHYWGYQFEAGSYATSYIPTYGTSVTRNVDSSSLTSATDLIGQTEGTIFLEVDAVNFASDQRFSISDGTSANRIALRMSTGGVIQLSVVIGSTTQASIVGSGSIGNTYKIAGAYKLNDFVLYINGLLVGVDTNGTISGAFSRIATDRGDGLGNDFYNPINQALLFKTRLSNEELATLTTI